MLTSLQNHDGCSAKKHSLLWAVQSGGAAGTFMLYLRLKCPSSVEVIVSIKLESTFYVMAMLSVCGIFLEVFIPNNQCRHLKPIMSSSSADIHGSVV